MTDNLWPATALATDPRAYRTREHPEPAARI
jgi:hypothetical protein